MSAPGPVIQLTPAEIFRLEDFRTLELRSLKATLVTADEMIDALFAERCRLEASARAAMAVYGGEYDAGVVRRAAVLGKAGEFLELVQRHRDDVLPILRGGGKAKRAKRE